MPSTGSGREDEDDDGYRERRRWRMTRKAGHWARTEAKARMNEGGEVG